ncbi:hypothetical protein LTR08_000586 [Meristemomyces frigidus]|nr:hypothetical protein LTR08_000586 [Meristemomyces frigidus]
MSGTKGAGDIATAIKIIYCISRALDQANGAKKHYAVSCGFLQQLLPILRRIEAQVTNPDEEQTRQDYSLQCAAINVAYEKFDNYLAKKYHGLSAKEPSTASRLLVSVKWALDEMHEKVQKLKDNMSDALQPYQTLMMQDVMAGVSILLAESQAAAGDREQGEERLKVVQGLLVQLQERDMMYHNMQTNYQTQLANEQRAQQEGNTAAIRGDLVEMKAEQATKADVQAIQVTHKADLEALWEGQRETSSALEAIAASRTDLLLFMQQQERQTQDREEAARWKELRTEAKEQAEESKRANEQMQTDIGAAANAIDGVGKLTNDKRLAGFSEKLKGIGEITGVLGFFGRGSKDDDGQDAGIRAPAKQGQSQQERPRPAARVPTVAPPQRCDRSSPTSPQPRQPSPSEPQRRAPRPPPPMPTLPPPPRPDRSVSTPPNIAISRQRGLRTRPLVSPPQRVITCPGPGLYSSLPPPCTCGTRRDYLESSTSAHTLSLSPSTLSRPPLPARPQTEVSASRLETGSRPPLPPRSPVLGRPQAPAKPHLLMRSPSASSPASPLPSSNSSIGARRPSATVSFPPHTDSSPTTITTISCPTTTPTSSLPYLTSTSPTTISSSSSPPASGHQTVPPAHASGASQVQKWLASTARAAGTSHNKGIEMDVFEPSPAERERETGGVSMSVSQRRNFFAGAAIMSMSAVSAGAGAGAVLRA